MFEVPSMFRPPSMFGPPSMFTGVAQAATGVESTWCLSFDGSNDYVPLGTSSAYAPSTASYSCWIKTSNAGSGFRNVLCKDVNVGLNCSSNVLGVYDWSGTGQKSSGVNIADGLWHHVVFIKQAGVTNGSSIYIDGVLRLTTTYVSNTGTGNFSIAANGGGGENFSGLIDDVRIYSRAISSTEVTALYTNTSPPTDVTAYLPLEEGAGTTTAVKDATGSTIATATLTNGPTWHPQTPPKLVSGRVTSARSLSFNYSNNYVTVGDVTQMNSASQFTMSAWLKRASSSSQVNLGKSIETTSKIVAFELYVDAKMYFDVASDSGLKYGYCDAAGTDWMHFAMVFDGTQTGNANRLRGYVNGVQQSLTFVGTIDANLPNMVGYPLYLGKFRYGGGIDRPSDGRIDDPRIFSRALSAADIQKLCRGQNPTVNDPVGWWRLDETSGTTAVDSGSGGNNGTHVNGPTISTDVPAWLST